LKYAPDLTVQGISAGRQALVNRSYSTIAQSAPGVTSTAERIWDMETWATLCFVIVGLDLRNPAFFTQAYPLDSGTFLKPQSNGSVVIGKAVADLIGAKVGSKLTILTESNKPEEFVVVGIFNSETSIYSADTILMSINYARTFFDLPSDKVTDILVYVSDIDPQSKSTLTNYVARQFQRIA